MDRPHADNKDQTTRNYIPWKQDRPAHSFTCMELYLQLLDLNSDMTSS